MINKNRILQTLLIVVCCLIGATAQEESPLLKLNKGLPCLNKVYQVHGHVILDSLGVANYTADQLRQNLESASEAFAPICVGFELCSFDTIINYEFDSLPLPQEQDEVKQLFHLDNRINMYLATFLTPGTAGNAQLCGVKQMSGGRVFLSGTGPGVVIHELGHLFGLLHTFEGNGEELVSGLNCETTGDLICDTPSDPYVPGELLTQYLNLDNCEFISIKRDSMGQFYQPDVGNYMSYYSPCICGGFTRGQFLHMANSVLTAEDKLW